MARWTFNNPVPPSFLDMYSLSTLLFGCNPLCIVNRFLVLLSICCNSSLVQSRNALEYLSKDIAQVLIPFMTFSPLRFVSKIFLILRLYSFPLSLSFLSSWSHLPLLLLSTYTNHLHSMILYFGYYYYHYYYFHFYRNIDIPGNPIFWKSHTLLSIFSLSRFSWTFLVIVPEAPVIGRINSLVTSPFQLLVTRT